MKHIPVASEDPVDPAKLEAAILARRDASRRLNEDWENVDREVWAHTPESKD